MDLRTYLFFEKMTQTQFAKKLGCSRGYLVHIMLGVHRPAPDMSKKIYEMTGGKVWIEPSKKRLELRKKRGLPIKIEDEEGGKAA